MTIPQQLIDKVVRAWIINEGRDPDDFCEEWKYTGYADDARAAIAAIAGGVWEDGVRFGKDDPGTDWINYHNPYRQDSE